VLQAVRRHPLVTFFVLAFPLSWYPWILALARGTTTGPNPLGPLVAGLIVTAIVYGRRGVVDFLRRLVRGNVGPQWYLAAFGVPIALCAAAAGITSLTGSPMGALSWNWKELLDRFLFIFLFIGLGEEPGWRGFAIEHLQEKRSPLAASLILAPLWTIWHLPLMGSEFTLPILPAFVVSVFGGTFFLTWLYNRTRGSVLMTALAHATINTIGAATVFRAFSGPASVRLWWIYSLLWLAAGTAVLLAPSRTRVLVPNEG
jgi:membrane protease YdiL (CAAX protease family)